VFYAAIVKTKETACMPICRDATIIVSGTAMRFSLKIILTIDVNMGVIKFYARPRGSR